MDSQLSLEETLGSLVDDYLTGTPYRVSRSPPELKDLPAGSMLYGLYQEGREKEGQEKLALVLSGMNIGITQSTPNGLEAKLDPKCNGELRTREYHAIFKESDYDLDISAALDSIDKRTALARTRAQYLQGLGFEEFAREYIEGSMAVEFSRKIDSFPELADVLGKYSPQPEAD